MHYGHRLLSNTTKCSAKQCSVNILLRKFIYEYREGRNRAKVGQKMFCSLDICHWVTSPASLSGGMVAATAIMGWDGMMAGRNPEYAGTVGVEGTGLATDVKW